MQHHDVARLGKGAAEVVDLGAERLVFPHHEPGKLEKHLPFVVGDRGFAGSAGGHASALKNPAAHEHLFHKPDDPHRPEGILRMKTKTRLIACLAMILAATLSVSAVDDRAVAEMVTLKGVNGRFATFEVVRMGTVALVGRGKDGNEIMVKWSSIDIDYLAEKYPDLERRRKLAISGAAEVDAVFEDETDQAPVVTVASIKRQLVESLKKNESFAEKLLIRASNPNHALHKEAMGVIMNTYSLNLDGWLVDPVRQAMAEADKLPAGAERANFRDGVLAPALKALEEMRTAPKVSKHEWHRALARLRDELELK